MDLTTTKTENKMTQQKIKFIGHAKKWFDKTNGNTYHSVRISNLKTGDTLACDWRYGYEDHYKQTALDAMLKYKWLPKKYNKDSAWNYERENNYPIKWIDDGHGLKRDMVNWGEL